VSVPLPRLLRQYRQKWQYRLLWEWHN